MGRPASGALVSLVSAGNTGTAHYLYQLIDPAATTGIAVQSARYRENHPEDNITAFGDTAFAYSNQRADWSIDVTGRTPKTTRKLGHTSLITVSSGTAYVSRCRSFNLDVDFGELDLTPFDVSAYQSGQLDWKVLGPRSLARASFSWTGMRDASTTESPVFVRGDTAPALVFKLSEEGATDNTIGFSAITIERTWEAEITEDGVQVYGYSGVATGAITFAGSTNLLAAGALAPQYFSDSSGIPDQAVVIAANSTGPANVYTGKGYLSRFSAASEATGIIQVNATIRGSGPMVSAN
jgi:hypothetical protein